MSIITARVTNKYYYKTEFFGLLVDIKEKSSQITMEMFISVVSTKRIPQSFFLLKKNLPSVFNSTCFNEYNYPFKKEVRNTEIGHLFEHILLEFVCQMKRDSGVTAPVHNGVTNWNWYKDRRGVFHINIDAGRGDEEIMSVSIHKSMKLLSDILFTIPAGIVRKRKPQKLPTPFLYLNLK